MKHRLSGFTLIELLVAVAIVALLSSIGLPLASLAKQRNDEQQLRQALAQIRQALDDYKLAVEQGQVAATADASGYPPSLQVLVDGVADARDPLGRRRYFLRRIPPDPFAPPGLDGAEGWGLRSYASPADDPRSGADVYDVYSLSTRSALDGRPYRDW